MARDCEASTCKAAMGAARAGRRHQIKIDNGIGTVRSSQQEAMVRRVRLELLTPWATWAGVRHRWLRALHGATAATAELPPTVAYGARILTS